MSIEIRLPREVGTRPAVAPFLASLDEKLDGQRIVLDCRSLLSGTPSFADEMVKEILVERSADGLVVLGGTLDFATDLTAFATERGVIDRVSLEETACSAG